MKKLWILQQPASRRVVKAIFILGAALLAFMAPVLSQGEELPKLRMVRLLDYTVAVPALWVAEKPSSNFRLAQFKIPGKTEADRASMVVFYFGPGQGGSPEANIARWVSQFSRPDRRSVKPVVRRYKVGRLPVTSVELNGTYARGIGMGPQTTPLPDQTLLATIVETPKGNLTFQLWGPRATVAAHRSAHDEMIAGLKPAGA